MPGIATCDVTVRHKLLHQDHFARNKNKKKQKRSAPVLCKQSCKISQPATSWVATCNNSLYTNNQLQGKLGPHSTHPMPLLTPSIITKQSN